MRIHETAKIWSVFAVVLSVVIAVVSASAFTAREAEKIEQIRTEQVRHSQEIAGLKQCINRNEVTLGMIQKDIHYISVTLDELKADLKK